MTMAAFMIATVKLRDATKFGDYGKLAGPTIAQFGGEILMRGKFGSALAGTAEHDMAAVIGFPDRQALEDWYASPTYQELIALRDEGAEVTFVTYELVG